MAIARRKILVINGAPGLGKTRWVEEQFKGLEHPLLLRICAHWTERAALAAMVKLLRGFEHYDADRHAVHQLYKILTRELREAPRVIFVDEGDYLVERSRSIRLLHTLRDLFDETGCILVFISIARLGRTLSTGRGLIEAVASRVGATVTFTPASAADGQLLADGLIEDCRLSRDLVGHAVKSCAGVLRSLLTTFEEIERLAHAAKIDRLDLAKWRELQALTAPSADDLAGPDESPKLRAVI
ncbi:MAG TPA: ATP-binding protein [Candidatus Binataceae bacterium]|nr:ATP-binding protein [Candidatus Binataceae bacterium]